jgi:wyosine [tRNA(Phe)-imidazoG37] synthetase (radical SAM superfamily)
MAPLGFKHVFGPLSSRRLGVSLGVDVLQPKTCPLNCIYCELSRTTRLTLLRDEYVPAAEVIEEVSRALTELPRVDYVTFSGSGEPTLNSALGRMISGIKKQAGVPVAVLTNGVFLFMKEVRDDLLEADIVLPSLDAASVDVFRCINRPHPRLNLFRIIDGLVEFRNEYHGQIWLEILFVKDVNDSLEEVQRLKAAVARIKPDKVQLHTVSRPPAETTVNPVTQDFLHRAQRLFGGRSEVLPQEPKIIPTLNHSDLERSILAVASRRPVTVAELASTVGSHAEIVIRAIGSMVADHRLDVIEHGSLRLYVAPTLSEQGGAISPNVTVTV